MAKDDREVFDYFALVSGTSREIALLAFASYAEAKHDWLAFFEQRHGHPPSAETIERLVSDLPPSRLAEIRATATAFFDASARAYMQAVIENERDAAVDASILAEVRGLNGELSANVERATSFRATFWPNLCIGIAASVGFALLVIVAGVIFERDPSPFAIFKRLQTAPSHPPEPPPPPISTPAR